MTYTVAEARHKLPQLMKEAEAGACVTITKRGVPVVEIVRKSYEPRRKRVFGVLGTKKIVVDPNWARPQEDLDAWIAGDDLAVISSDPQFRKYKGLQLIWK